MSCGNSASRQSVALSREGSMNFFKRKFSFQEDEGETAPFEDPSQPTPPSAFSFSAIANKVSSTISAPTSPARTGESLAAALERSLQDRSRAAPPLPPDAKVLLVIDGHLVDWSKYFRNPNEAPIRVEQADFPELDLMCTEHSCTIEIHQHGKDNHSIIPNAVFVGPGATRSAQAKTILRALMAAHIPLLNSPTSSIAFMDRANLKKQLRKITLSDGSRIPFLPTVHYPHFHKFHPSTSFPVVISVNEGYQGIGKVRVNNHEELCDLEGILQIMGKGDTEVEVEPYVDLKYDLHVQKIGHEWKSFIRRGISRNWKSNVGSAVLEQIPTTERHKQYVRAISEYCGRMEICSIDILVSKEGREFVHDVNDVIAFFVESQEDDRRAACGLLKNLLHPPPRQAEVHREHKEQNGTRQHSHHLPRAAERAERPPPPDRRQSKEDVDAGGVNRASVPPANSASAHSFGDDTMGQLKRTFANIFGDGV